MRRIIAGLAVATTAALATVAPAQAAAPNPVKSLKKQFSPGHGVRVSETARSYVDGKTNSIVRTTGKLAFGKSGVAGADLTTRFKEPKGASDGLPASLLGNSRTVSTGGNTYVQGALFGGLLPEGKKWIRYEGQTNYQTNQLIDIFNPRVLKGVVSGAKVVKGDYKGTTTIGKLAAYQGVKLDSRLAKIKVKYLIDTDSRGLVTRVVSDWTLDFGLLGSSRTVTDSRYSAWGARVKIVAPPKSQWIDSEELLSGDTGAEVPTEIPDSAISSLGVGR